MENSQRRGNEIRPCDLACEIRAPRAVRASRLKRTGDERHRVGIARRPLLDAEHDVIADSDDARGLRKRRLPKF
jgi:hypothetical protein